MRRILGGILFISMFISNIHAQITVTNSAVANNFVANICGSGISFSNVTLTGNANSIAFFTSGASGGLGAAMNSGVVMSTGTLGPGSLDGPASNFSSDYTGGPTINELNVIAGANTYDGVILEFDFIPITNMINVNYIFGSEEYNEYVNSGYNDAFAFYISGPGIPGSVNIATVPATALPVTIDNINAGNSYGCGTGCINCAYYRDNCSNTYNNSMDGFTTMLTAVRTVIPCSTYHIRLMLADGGDTSFDSWVFIQENGLFAAGNPVVTSTASYAYGNYTQEDCANSNLVFTIPTALATNYSFNVSWSGTATSGVDYAPLPTTITIPAGQTSYSLPINVYADGVPEGTETIVCTFAASVCSTGTITLYIEDSAPFSITPSANQSICIGNSATIGVTPTGANGTVTYLWSTGATTQNITVSPTSTTTYTVTATDACGRTATATITVTVGPLPTSTFTITSPVCEGQAATITYTGTAAAGANYNWNFAGGTVISGSGAGPYQVVWNTGGYYNVTLQVNVGSCSSAVTTNQILVNYNPTVDAGNNLTVCEDTPITITDNSNPSISGSWSHGLIPGVPFVPPVGVNWYYYTGTVVSTGCSATDSVSITVNANPVIDAGPDIVTCEGQPITVNGSGGVSYVWPSPIVNGVPFTLAPGNYSVTMYGEDANGCYDTSLILITINPTPAAPVISSNSPVCSGSTLNLTSNVASGIVWAGPNGFSSTQQNPSISNVTTAASGTYTAYRVVAGCTSATSSINVVVNPTPATPVLGSNSPVCTGQALNLTSNAAIGIIWSGPNGFNSTLQNPSITSVTTAASGSYSAYIVANGCTSGTANINVVVNTTPAAPTLSSNSPVCTGLTLNLSSTSATGNIWSGPNGFSSTAQNPTIANVTTAAAGTYTGYVVSNGCTSATASVNVVINPTPATPVLGSNSPVCTGQTLNLTSNAATGIIWSGPNGFNSTVQNPSITGVTTAASGSYSAYVVENGCTSATATINVIVNPTPAAPVLSSNGPLCSGANLTVSSNVATGNNWTRPNGMTSTAQNVTISNVTTASSGTYTNYIVSNGCTSATSSINVVINQTPAAPVLNSNTPVCSGNNLELTSNAASGITWTGPNGFTSTVQNPTITNATTAASGSYSAYIIANGCTSTTATHTVVVNPTPATPVLNSNAPLCSGNTLNLGSNVAIGNVWTGPNGFSSNAQNPTVVNATVVASGTYSNLIVANGCSSGVATINVVVNQTPVAPVLGSNSPVCSGNALNLTSDVGTGINWSGPNSFSATTQNPSINNVTTAASGTYTAYVVANSCTSANATVNVTITQTPTTPVLGSNSPLCEGSAINLTSDIANGINWSGPNGFSSTIQNPTIANAALADGGSYSAYAVFNACTSGVATINVVVNAIPQTPNITSNSPLCAGDILNLTSDVSTGNVWVGPNGFTSNIQNPSINNVSVNAAGTYSAYVVANGCTSATSNLVLVINPTPAAPALNSNAPICENDVLNLTSNVANGVIWSGPNGFNSTIQNPSVNPATLADAGTYSAYTVALGCTSATTNLNVAITPLPNTPNLTNNGPLCEGALVNLTSDVPGSVFWTGPNGFTSIVQNPALANADIGMAGSYSAYVVVNGCTSATASTNLVINPVPAAVSVSNNGPLCTGQTLDLNAGNSAGGSYYWSGPNNFLSNNQNEQIINAQASDAGVYSVYVVLNGCSSAVSSTNVQVTNLPTVPTINYNGPLCEGNSLELTSAALQGVTFIWNGPNNFTSNFPNPVINPVTLNNSGQYSLYLVAGVCTSDIATVDVVVNPNSINIITHAICSGESFNFAGNNYGHTGSYTIIMSNTYGCDSIITLNLTAHPNPEADFSSPVNVSLGNPLMQVYDNSYNASDISYEFNGTVINQPDWEYVFQNEGVYSITQIVSNGNCRDSLTKEVNVNPYTNIFIPNTFTANEDGKNDEFKVIATYIEDFEIFIFDRWGELVFHSDNIYTGWNGGFKNNIDKIMKQDTYVYRINYTEFNGEKKQILGHVNLLR